VVQNNAALVLELLNDILLSFGGDFFAFRAGMILRMDEVRFPPSWRIGRSSCMTNGSVGYGGGFRH